MRYNDMSTKELKQREAQLMLDYEMCSNPVEMGKEIKRIIREIDKRGDK